MFPLLFYFWILVTIFVSWLSAVRVSTGFRSTGLPLQFCCILNIGYDIEYLLVVTYGRILYWQAGLCLRKVRSRPTRSVITIFILTESADTGLQNYKSFNDGKTKNKILPGNTQTTKENVVDELLFPGTKRPVLK